MANFFDVKNLKIHMVLKMYIMWLIQVLSIVKNLYNDMTFQRSIVKWIENITLSF
jgi:hypothetical protein